jgi:hypothetical protein
MFCDCIWWPYMYATSLCLPVIIADDSSSGSDLTLCSWILLNIAILSLFDFKDTLFNPSRLIVSSMPVQVSNQTVFCNKYYYCNWLPRFTMCWPPHWTWVSLNHDMFVSTTSCGRCIVQVAEFISSISSGASSKMDSSSPWNVSWSSGCIVRYSKLSTLTSTQWPESWTTITTH